MFGIIFWIGEILVILAIIPWGFVLEAFAGSETALVVGTAFQVSLLLIGACFLGVHFYKLFRGRYAQDNT